MEISKGKRFIYRDSFLDKIYIAKDIQTLFDEVELAREYIGLFAVVDTEIGEVVFDVDSSYDGEPIIMRKVMHYDSFVKFNNDCEFIKLK